MSPTGSTASTSRSSDLKSHLRVEITARSARYRRGMADTGAIRAALDLVRAGDGFAAHEVLEDLWRAAAPAERDLYQGLVHVAVATYQESRGNAVGRARQLAKAHRRLAAYDPVYDGL